MNKKTSLETAVEINSQRSDHAIEPKKKVQIANPFKIPEDQNLFKYLDEHRDNRKKARSSLLDISDRNDEFRALKLVKPKPISEEEKALDELIPHIDSSNHQDGLKEFVQQKREIFLAQLAIDTKREELQRLERLEREEQASLKAKEAEIALFRDQFRSFLEFDGQATMEARRSAEKKSKERIEVSLKIKQVSSQISTLRNEIAHQDEKLQECIEYQKFLEALTPVQWRKTNPFPAMYFNEPNQLLDIIATLEEQNMFLINHCQEAEETVERYRYNFNSLMNNRDGKITELVYSKDEKQEDLSKTQERNDQYKAAGVYKHGNELTEAEFKDIQVSIVTFHEQLGFDSASSNDITTMMRRIENKMQEMIIKLESMDQSIVKSLALKKEHHRREQDRAEKQAQQKLVQAEKMKKAVMMANKPIKRKTGRPLMERMMPLKGKSRVEEEEKFKAERAQEEADQELLFGNLNEML